MGQTFSDISPSHFTGMNVIGKDRSQLIVAVCRQILQGVFDHTRYIGKTYSPVEKRLHRDFVCGIQNRRRGTSGTGGFVCQTQTREAIEIRALEIKARKFKRIQTLDA